MVFIFICVPFCTIFNYRPYDVQKWILKLLKSSGRNWAHIIFYIFLLNGFNYTSLILRRMICVFHFNWKYNQSILKILSN
jgi:hypothetical protein